MLPPPCPPEPSEAWRVFEHVLQQLLRPSPPLKPVRARRRAGRRARDKKARQQVSQSA